MLGVMDRTAFPGVTATLCKPDDCKSREEAVVAKEAVNDALIKSKVVLACTFSLMFLNLVSVSCKLFK